MQLRNLAQRSYTKATAHITQLQNRATRDKATTNRLQLLYDCTVSAVNALHNANDKERKAHANTKRVTTRKINKLKKQLESRR